MNVRDLPLAALLGLLLAPAAPAQVWQERVSEEEEEETLGPEAIDAKRRVRRALYPVNPRISRYLGAAQEATDEGDPEKGLELLAGLNPKRMNPVERAMAYRLQAFVAYSAGNPQGAIDAFDKVLAEEILSLEDDNRIRFNIAQLYAGQQMWQETIDALDRWFQYEEAPDPLAYYLLAIAYYQMENASEAIVNAEKAVDLSPEPREGWLQLLTALYIEKEDYANAAPVLEELVLRFPKKLYWVQLSLIYGALENYKHSLAVQQVAYAQGLLTEDRELRRLARSYLFNELPYPAARVLEKGLADGAMEADPDAYELLSNSWIAAREYDKALVPLKKAADLSADGKLYVRLGQVHLQREEWSQAAEALHASVRKGSLEDPGNALLLLGIAYYNAERVGQARTFFARARQHAGTRPEAERWLKHLEGEGAEAAAAVNPT